MKCHSCGKIIEGEIDQLTKIPLSSSGLIFAHLFCAYNENFLKAGQLELPPKVLKRLEELDPRLALYFRAGSTITWSQRGGKTMSFPLK